MPKQTVEQLEARFRAMYVVDPVTECHLWQGHLRRGYGGVRRGGRNWQAHRWAYEQKHGPVPEGLVLDHFACDTKRCVNPDHVRPATDRENILRGNGVTAVNAARTHCYRGHPLTPDNLAKSIYRRCLTCKREHQRAWRAARRAA